MGNASTQLSEDQNEDIWWSNASTKTLPQDQLSVSEHSQTRLTEETNSNETLADFKLEFERKRNLRKQILSEKRQQFEDMRNELVLLKEENKFLKQNAKNISVLPDFHSQNELKRLRVENEELKSEIVTLQSKQNKLEVLADRNKDLQILVAEIQAEVQSLNSQLLDFENQKKDYETHVVALKDVAKISKELVSIREEEIQELKKKMAQIKERYADNEILLMSEYLKEEYERQLAQMKNLKLLYEEKQQAYKKVNAELKSLLFDKKIEVENQSIQIKELQDRTAFLEKENSERYDTIKTLESNLGLSQADCKQYESELSVINQLFSEILLGFNNSQDINLDRLIKHLEQHHDLLQNIVVNEISTTVSSALPKVLLDLVNSLNETSNEDINKIEIEEKQLEDTSNKECNIENTTTLHNLNSAEEIVENLPKVWRVLIELLSHQQTPVMLMCDQAPGASNPCYKQVETAKGPRLVASVSQTFIRLKNLIVEKKSLEKDLSNLKQLNSHLEVRLQDQEKRLENVSAELTTTWSVVDKLKKEHQLLHTQEQILKYELAQKRKLLKELRSELEYSREKWQQAREKNSATEKQWKQLRGEFAARKRLTEDVSNNSVESGYSDDRETDDERGYESDVSECNPKDVKEDDIEQPNPIFDVVKSEIKEIEALLNNESGINPQSEEVKPELTQSTSETVTDSTNLTIVLDKETLPIENCTNVIKEESENETVTVTTEEQSSSNSSNQDEPESSTKQNNSISNTNLESSSNNQNGPSTSTTQTSTKPSRTLEEILAARDERFKRLESQCKELITQATNTSNRSVEISNKLDNLHEVYGETSETSSNNASEQTENDTNDDSLPNNNNNTN